MAKLTMFCGFLLATLGVVTYLFAQQFGAEKASPTALIPACLGVPLMLLGWLTVIKPLLRKHLIHTAVLLAALGFLASMTRLCMVMLTTPNFHVGVIANMLMAIICAIYVTFAVRSFISARRQRTEMNNA